MFILWACDCCLICEDHELVAILVKTQELLLAAGVQHRPSIWPRFENISFRQSVIKVKRCNFGGGSNSLALIEHNCPFPRPAWRLNSSIGCLRRWRKWKIRHSYKPIKFQGHWSVTSIQKLYVQWPAQLLAWKKPLIPACFFVPSWEPSSLFLLVPLLLKLGPIPSPPSAILRSKSLSGPHRVSWSRVNRGTWGGDEFAPDRRAWDEPTWFKQHGGGRSDKNTARNLIKRWLIQGECRDSLSRTFLRTSVRSVSALFSEAKEKSRT